MKRTLQDKTLERNHIHQWMRLVSEYELIKAKRHPVYSMVKDFYHAHGLPRQTFIKFYHRYSKSLDPRSLLPAKRGPKYKTRRFDVEVEARVLALRAEGRNRYDIYAILKKELGSKTPSPATIYNISKRAGLNRLKPKMKQERQRIIKERAGELGHVDCHYLSKNLIANCNKRYYLVGIIDDASRVAWAEVVEDIKSLSVMFAALKSINLLAAEHQIRFEEMLSDNGSEFASPRNLEGHPFERMLLELGIKHRYTRPYSPQTNGKIERFWKTIQEDLIEGTHFESIEHFKKELDQYLMYYNHLRTHQGINGKTPVQQLEQLQVQ